MKALFITKPGATEYGTVSAPQPKPGEVLLQVRRLGYCGSDLKIGRAHV